MQLRSLDSVTKEAFLGHKGRVMTVLVSSITFPLSLHPVGVRYRLATMFIHGKGQASKHAECVAMGLSDSLQLCVGRFLVLLFVFSVPFTHMHSPQPNTGSVVHG